MKHMATALVVLLGLLVLAGAVYLFVIRPGAADSFDFGHTQRTLQTGTPASATVLSLRDTGGRLNSNPAIEFQLEVQPPEGLVYTATTRAIISTRQSAPIPARRPHRGEVRPIRPQQRRDRPLNGAWRLVQVILRNGVSIYPDRQQKMEKGSDLIDRTPFSDNSLTMSYFHTGTRTIIGAKAFHCPVRDGKEWDHLAMVIRLDW
jgi:hypothetical protein